MNYDKEKVDEVTLALVSLTLHDGCRAWKGLDWGTLNRLHEKGMIEKPDRQSKIGGADRRGPHAMSRSLHEALWEQDVTESV